MSIVEFMNNLVEIFFDAPFWLQAGIAIFAGALSFLSPCVLPIAPPYLAYMAGTSMDALMDEEKAAPPKLIGAATAFVLGLSTVFLIMGFTASLLGQTFLQYQREIAIGAGLVIIVFGLHFLGIFRIPFLYREARLDAGDKGGSILGAYLLGLAFAFGWTPCIGPLLSSILGFAALSGSVAQGTALLGFYAIGLGIPFLLAAFFIQRFMGFLRKFRRYLPIVEKAMGCFLVLIGVLMVTGAFSRLSFWLLETFPALGQIG